MMRWRKERPISPAVRLNEDMAARTRATSEAAMAELRARRAQLLLNNVLEGVIAAGRSPAPNIGGRYDGDS